MNNKQREELRKALDILTQVQEEEQEKYDNAPEGLQDSERVEKFQENADSLLEAIVIIEEVLEGC